MREEKQRWSDDVRKVISRLKEHGFLPKEVSSTMDRGRGVHQRFARKMWKDAAENHGQVIGLLNQALDNELQKNGPEIEELMKSGQSPCGGKMDFIEAAIDSLKLEESNRMLPKWISGATTTGLTEAAKACPEAQKFQESIETLRTNEETAEQSPGRP